MSSAGRSLGPLVIKNFQKTPQNALLTDAKYDMGPLPPKTEEQIANHSKMAALGSKLDHRSKDEQIATTGPLGISDQVYVAGGIIAAFILVAYLLNHKD